MNFNKYLEREILKGMQVAELYHGEKDDILRKLSKCVGLEGQVHGVDRLNPFSNHRSMRNLQKVPNISLHKAELPPIPSIIPSLDAIVIREFIWTYIGSYPLENELVFSEINRALKINGHLILNLNSTEQENEKESPYYQKIISRVLPNLIMRSYERDLLAYQKHRK